MIRLAWENILRNRRRSLVTILVAALGTASLLIAGGFTLYTYTTLQEGSARDTGHLTITHPDYFQRDEDSPLQYGLRDHQALRQTLAQDPRVRRVLPRISLSGLISNGEKSMIFVGTGADIAAEADVRGAFLAIQEGELADGDRTPDGVPRILIGNELARSLNAHPGSGLTLLVTTTDGGMNALDVVVAGVASTGWRDLDKRLVYLGVEAASRLLVTDRLSTLAVVLHDTEQTAPVLAEYRQRDTAHAYSPWWEQASYYVSVKALYDRIFGLLGMIIAALVFFSVANTLSMAVVERTREIGTLRALGATPREIVAGFMREGGLIGLVGALSGAAVAGSLSLLLTFSEVQMPPPPGRSIGYPLKIMADPCLYGQVIGGVVLLCVLAAWRASRQAAKRPIVEALGHV